MELETNDWRSHARRTDEGLEVDTHEGRRRTADATRHSHSCSAAGATTAGPELTGDDTHGRRHAAPRPAGRGDGEGCRRGRAAAGGDQGTALMGFNLTPKRRA